MRDSIAGRAAWLIPALSVAVFVLAGMALIPWPGLQNDELFFAGPLYDRNAGFYYAQLGAIRVPFMLVSYTGALKTWLYAGLLAMIDPSPWAIRVPVLLAGALTIWLTWRWVHQIGMGTRAAAITIVLLATDTSYLLTNTFDWGPVALQHLLMMAGLVAMQTWIARGSWESLALAFFLWGLGLWEKTVMIWPLSGLAAASLLIYRREVIRRMRFKNVAIASACFALGASPLIWYNIARPGETATLNLVTTSANEFPLKLKALRETIDGSSMFYFMVYEDVAPGNRATNGLHIDSLPVAIKRYLGTHKRNYMPFGFVLAFFCFLGQWRSPSHKVLMFLGITVTVAWFEMILTKGAGVFVHHDILLWPFTLAFVGLAFGEACASLGQQAQLLFVMVIIVLAVGNLLTTNEYLADFITNGGEDGWTDAIYGLSRAVDKTGASWVGLVDWGCLNDLRLLKKRQVGLFGASDPVMGNNPASADLEAVRRMATTPGVVFIQHVKDKQIFAGVNDRFRQAALEVGFTEELKQVIPDSHGRPVFELFTLGNNEKQFKH